MDGKALGLAHLGYGAENTYELIGYYSTVFGIQNTMTQEIHHHYIGRINGVTGCPYVIGFVRSDGDETRLEFVGCVNAVKGHALFRPEVGGHSHLIYTTGNLDSCYARMREHHVKIYSEIATIDYGANLGKRAFVLQDFNGYYIQVVEDTQSQVKSGIFDKLVGVSYTVGSVQESAEGFCEGMGAKSQMLDVSKSHYLNDLWCNDHPTVAGFVRLRDDENFFIELVEARRENPESKSIWVNSLGAMHVCVMVDDIQKVYERMAAQGKKFVGPPSPVELGINKGAKAIFTKVSDEILVELFQGKATAV